MSRQQVSPQEFNNTVIAFLCSTRNFDDHCIKKIAKKNSESNLILSAEIFRQSRGGRASDRPSSEIFNTFLSSVQLLHRLVIINGFPEKRAVDLQFLIKNIKENESGCLSIETGRKR